MSWQDLGIEQRQVGETLAATVRTTLGSHRDLLMILNEIAQHIPREDLAGPPFCVVRFVTSITEGLDAEIGFPVSRPIHTEDLTTHVHPPLEVLSLLHTGTLDTLGQTYRTLYGAAADQGLISDEFAREVYPDWERAEWKRVELQFVLHNWNRLFVASLDRVLGEEARHKLVHGVDEPGVEPSLNERFEWVKAMVERLDRSTGEDEVFDVLSSCAHVFPKEQIDKLRAAYVQAIALSGDELQAVDAVIAFMGQDPGWREPPRREGRVIIATKAPREAQAYQDARSEAERKRAYCYCPIVRNRLEQGMPATFCYCGAGWYRQQWEGAIGQAVRIDIVKSILKGDNECQFAVRLPGDLEPHTRSSG